MLINHKRVFQEYLKQDNAVGREAMKTTANQDAVTALSRQHSIRPISTRDDL